MKKNNLFVLFGVALSLSSCASITGVFSSGFTTGVVVSIIVLIIIIILLFKLFGGGNNKSKY